MLRRPTSAKKATRISVVPVATMPAVGGVRGCVAGLLLRRRGFQLLTRYACFASHLRGFLTAFERPFIIWLPDGMAVAAICRWLRRAASRNKRP